MKIKKNNGGYSAEIAQKYLDPNDDFVILQVEKINIFDEKNKKYTDEYSHHKIAMTAADEDTEVFSIKIENIDEKIGKFSVVKIEGLEGCEVGRNVYFKAQKLDLKGKLNINSYVRKGIFENE